MGHSPACSLSDKLPTAAAAVLLSLAMSFLAACSQNPAPAVRALTSPAATNSGEPNLATTDKGAVVMSWLERDGERAALKFSTFKEWRWTAPQTIATGTNWFVNWADFPSVVPIDENLWAAHWLVRSASSPYAYDIALSVSTDGGNTWPPPFTPHADGTQTEHGFVTLFPWANGFSAVWLDGRKTVNDYDEADPTASGMTLRAAHVSADRRLADRSLVDDLVCDCCQTDVALTPGGAVAAYRNRGINETRDIYVARLDDGGWQPGVAVFDDGWQIAGCPVNGPAIAAADDTVAVAWFTAADDRPLVKIAFSEDGGRHFDAPLEVAGGSTLGRVDLLLLDAESALLSSLQDNGDGTAEVVLHRIDIGSDATNSLAIARTGAGRLSGFPRLARTNDGVIVAWTDADDTGTQVRTALIDPWRL